MALNIGKEIANSKQMTVPELREKYEAVFCEPTRAGNKDRLSKPAWPARTRWIDEDGLPWILPRVRERGRLSGRTWAITKFARWRLV